MNRLLVTLLSVCFLFLASCGFQERRDAQVFYNRINGINDTLGSMTNEWYNLLHTSLTSKNFTTLNPYRIRLGAFISQARSDVANMKLSKENEKVKNEEDALLANQSAMVTDVYPQFEQYSEFTPAEVVAGTVKQLQNDENDVKVAIKRIKGLLATYSAKYSLKPAPVTIKQ